MPVSIKRLGSYSPKASIFLTPGTIGHAMSYPLSQYGRVGPI